MRLLGRVRCERRKVKSSKHADLGLVSFLGDSRKKRIKPKEKLAILLAEVIEAGDPITELVDDVDRGGEEGVELGDASCLSGNHPRFAVQLLLWQVCVLQQS